MKRITFICNHLFGGGAERVLVSLVNQCDRKGYLVSIVAFDGKERYPINENILVKEIGGSSSLLKQSRAIRKELRQIKPDIVISFEYFVNLATIIAAAGMGVRVIVSERNDPARVGSGLLKDPLRNLLYTFCDKVVCQTPDAKAYFPAYVQKHTVVILNPVKEGLPEPWSGIREHRVVNFCRLNKQKNLQLLIDAFSDFHKEFEDYVLVIYGNGPEAETLSKYITDSNMDEIVQIRPNCPDVHEKVLRSAMFVSTSDYEGLSNSMLEAMCIGLPVICTDCPCGGARMVIQDGENGILVPVGDRRELANAMKQVANDENMAKGFGERASRLRKKLVIDKIVKQWETLF